MLHFKENFVNNARDNPNYLNSQFLFKEWSKVKITLIFSQGRLLCLDNQFSNLKKNLKSKTKLV